jgi:hypothetical protein
LGTEGYNSPAWREGLMAASDQSTSPGFEELLRKYLAVWLWSILFGGTTGLTYTMLSFYSGERWGPLGLPLSALTAVAIFFLLIAWSYLYLYLRDFLIPDVLIGRQRGESVDRSRGEHILRRAYLMMIVSGVAGLLTRLLRFLLQSLRL